MKELRCILFTNREALTAILERRRKVNDPLPVGAISGFRLERQENSVKATIMADQGREVITIPESELQAALLAHCMARNVPLPVEADKSVYLIRGRATLIITMNFNKTARLVSMAASEEEVVRH